VKRSGGIRRNRATKVIKRNNDIRSMPCSFDAHATVELRLTLSNGSLKRTFSLRRCPRGCSWDCQFGACVSPLESVVPPNRHQHLPLHWSDGASASGLPAKHAVSRPEDCRCPSSLQPTGIAADSTVALMHALLVALVVKALTHCYRGYAPETAPLR